jgi:Chlorophyll A-B binding protein
MLAVINLYVTGFKTMQTKKDEAKFGFTGSAENLNGRMAMIGFIAAVVTELVTGQGVLHFLGLM